MRNHNRPGTGPGTLLAVLVLALIAASAIAASYLSERLGDGAGVEETEIRARLLRLKDLSGGSPELTRTSSAYSSALFDFTVPRGFTGPLPWAGGVVPSPAGERAFTWRVRLPYEARFSAAHAGTNPGGYTVTVTDGDGLAVYARTGEFVLPASEVTLAPGIYAVSASSASALDSLTFSFTPTADAEAGGGEPPAMRTIRLTLPPMAGRDLRRLVATTERSTTTQIVKMAGGRVDGEIVGEDGGRVAVKVGLSGRSREHVTWFPSVDVKVRGGGSYQGIPSFKLYRYSTKQGALDMVYLSVLRDMGYMVPRQDVVKLVVNGAEMGIYILMETPSPAMFTSLRKIEGDIIGVEGDRLFFDYPWGAALENRYFYRPAAPGGERQEGRGFLSADFAGLMDGHSFARFLSFASLYATGHGLGVDDLRFYRDPASGLYHPIPRDLGPELPETGLNTFLSNVDWLPNTPHYTVWPVRRLLDGGYEFDRDSDIFFEKAVDPDTHTNLTDLHFSIPHFLEDAAGMALANRYLDYLAGDRALREKIRARLVNTLSLIVRETGDALAAGQLDRIAGRGVPAFTGEVGRQLRDTGVVVAGGAEDYYWNLRSARTLRDDLPPSILSPVPLPGQGRDDYDGRLALAFLVEREVTRLINDEGGGIRPSFAPADGEGGGAATVRVPPPSTAGAEAGEGGGDGSMRADNVATYLKTWSTGGDAVVAFLVRNATEGAGSFALVPRDGIGAYAPFVNRTFRAVGGPFETATTRQIMANHFNRGELVRLVAFRVPQGERPLFYTLALPEGIHFLYPHVLYVPPAPSGPLRGTAPDRPGLPEGMVELADRLVVPAGASVKVAGDLVVPEGMALHMEEGSELVMSPGASVLVAGDLVALGTAELPVRIRGGAGKDSGRPWGGLYVGAPSRTVRVELANVEISDFGSFPKTMVAGRGLNGGVTFQNARVGMRGVTVRGSRAEDAVNLISSVATIVDVTIEGTASDAVDLDFTNAYIKGLVIRDSAGDGLDVSGSLVVCEGSRFERIEDKGISVGEMSNLTVTGSEFAGNGMGIANKDQSRLVVRSSAFEGNGVALAEFIKKPYFGRPASELGDVAYRDNGADYRWLGFYSY